MKEKQTTSETTGEDDDELLSHHNTNNHENDGEMTSRPPHRARRTSSSNRHHHSSSSLSNRDDVDMDDEACANNNDHHLLLNSVPGIMYEYKMNHGTGQSSFPYVSAYCEELLGVSAEAVMEDPAVMVNLIHPQDVVPFTDAVVKSMTEMTMFDHSMRMKNARTNKFMMIYDKSNPFRTEERNEETGIMETFTTWKGFIFVMENHRLVAEEQEEVEQLEEAKVVSKELQDLMNSNFLHFFELDLKGFVQQWNSAMVSTTGYTSEMAHNSPFLSYVPDQDKIDVSNFLASVIRNEQETDDAHNNNNTTTQLPKLHCKLKAANKKHLDLCITAKGKRDAVNNLVGLYVLAQDVTSIKQIERQRNDAMRLAESEKALTEWLSHEIRNPLSVAMEAAQALEATVATTIAASFLGNSSNSNSCGEQQQGGGGGEEEEDDGVGASYLQLIRRSITYVVDVLTNMLDLNKFSEGKIVMRPEMCNIYSDILIPTREMMFLSNKSSSSSSSADKVRVEVVGQEEEEDDVGIYVDKLRLKQVVTNLVSNSIKYTTRGFIRMQVNNNNNDDDKNKNFVTITVSDSGIGVKPSEYHNLFSRWEQLGSSINGAGIGLCLCKSLVTAMGGSISLNKEYHSGIIGHAGAQFIVCLPKRTRQQQEEGKNANVPAFHALAAALTANTANIMVGKNQQGSGTGSSSSGSSIVVSTATTTNNNLQDKQTTTTTTTTSPPPRRQRLKNDANTIHGNYRILVVDDERMGQKLLKRRFSRIFPQACIVDCASSGEDALQMSQHTCYDIITMDHFMKVGEMTGEETIRELRKRKTSNNSVLSSSSDALIVGISGNTKRDVHLAAGANDFFQKPLPSDDVVVRRLSLKLAPPNGWNVLLLLLVVDETEEMNLMMKQKLQQVSISSNHVTTRTTTSCLERSEKRWKYTTCNDSKKAMELLEKETFDLIVFDECLGNNDNNNGVSGTDLLCEFARTKTSNHESILVLLNSSSASTTTTGEDHHHQRTPSCFDVVWSKKPLPSVETMRQDLIFQLMHSRGGNNKKK